jgi:ubiquinone/menaquinone biosynthesis C-methylase UbiE
MSKSQKDAFLDYEADNYFFRNADVKFDPEKDTVFRVVTEYGLRPKNILEIGCSTGYRLDALRKKLDAKVSGIEPSAGAIARGMQLYPEVQFTRGTVDEMGMYASTSFDMVIIGFVLYVVDREILFKVLSETDRVLANGGTLIIIDFFSEKPTRNAYAHIKDIEAFTYKQNYEEIFVASRIYQLLDKRSMSHTTKQYDLSGDYYDKFSVTTLRKDLSAGYRQ